MTVRLTCAEPFLLIVIDDERRKVNHNCHMMGTFRCKWRVNAAHSGPFDAIAATGGVGPGVEAQSMQVGWTLHLHDWPPAQPAWLNGGVHREGKQQ